MTNRDTFINAYIECALWSSTYEPEPDEVANLDDGEHELAYETRALMEHEAGAFYDANAADIEHECSRALGQVSRGSNAEMAGHDFWLTRNGHGAGFWDGDWAEPFADRLDKASKAAGSRDLYVADNGEIYQA